MSTEPNQEEAIFNAVVELSTPEQRLAYIRRACGADSELLRNVEALLRAYEESGGFLNEPAAGGALAQEAPLIGAKSAAAERPGQHIGRYKLLQKIGEGGFGDVWMAEQGEPVHRRVALKIIKLGMDTKEVVARFEAERQALAILDHPNIARIFDGGATENGRPYFVMELVRGVKITDYCDQAQFSPQQRLELFIQVCQAVQHAHQKGLIHRDLKPSNILVSVGDAGVPVPKIIDFGITKAVGGRLTDKTLFTRFHEFVGTPAYMSPEQAALTTLDIDTRSDIYSLGVLLYELLTGRTPFETREVLAAGLDALRRTICEQEPLRPSTRLGTLSKEELTTAARQRHCEAPKLISTIRGDLDWIVMRCLEKDRTRRYETANGLAMDLKRHLNHEPVVARPASAAYRFQRLLRRNKVVFAAAGAVLLALLTGLGASMWMYFEEKRALARVVAAEQLQMELRRKAEAEAAKSGQVSKFLKRMLTGVGPAAAKGRDTALLREILDSTAESVGQELGAHPEVEAELRSTLAHVYLALGDYSRAEAMFRAALALWKELPEDNGRRIRDTLNDLAVTLQEADKLPEAEKLQLEELALTRKALGEENAEVATGLHNLATVLFKQGKLGEAEGMLRQALALRRRLLSSGDPDLALSLNNLGVVLQTEGKLGEAEAVQMEAIASLRRAYSNDHPHVARSLTCLANLLHDQEKYAQAEQTQREALTIFRRLLGSEHQDVAIALANLAAMISGQGRFAEAELLHREALAMRRKLLGEENADVANSLHNLGHTLQNKGALDEAETLLREAVRMRKRLLGGEHLELAMSLDNLAAVLHDRGRFAEAEATRREALTVYRKQPGKDHPNVAVCLMGLAFHLQKQNKLAEAELIAREAVALQEEALPDHWLTFHYRFMLGRILLEQKRNSEAEPLLLAGYEGTNLRRARIPSSETAQLKEAVENVVRLYNTLAQPDRATEWQTRLRALEAPLPASGPIQQSP